MARTGSAATINRATLFDRYVTDAVLGWLSLAMLAAVATAVARGHGEWAEVPAKVWVHLALIAVALGLTPVMLLRHKGDRMHRRLGWLWATAMLATALISFTIRSTNHGSFSFIHLISLYVLIAVPRLVWTARTHQVARHRANVRGMVIGALLIAGFFTFPFNRLLGHWLFGQVATVIDTNPEGSATPANAANQNHDF